MNLHKNLTFFKNKINWTIQRDSFFSVFTNTSILIIATEKYSNYRNIHTYLHTCMEEIMSSTVTHLFAFVYLQVCQAVEQTLCSRSPSLWHFFFYVWIGSDSDSVAQTSLELVLPPPPPTRMASILWWSFFLLLLNQFFVTPKSGLSTLDINTTWSNSSLFSPF